MASVSTMKQRGEADLPAFMFVPAPARRSKPVIAYIKSMARL